MKVVWVLCFAFLVGFSWSMTGSFLQNLGETLQSKLCNCDCEQVSQVPNDPSGDYETSSPSDQKAENNFSKLAKWVQYYDEIIDSYLINFVNKLRGKEPEKFINNDSVKSVDDKIENAQVVTSAPSSSVKSVDDKIENAQGVTNAPSSSTSAPSASATVSNDKPKSSNSEWWQSRIKQEICVYILAAVIVYLYLRIFGKEDYEIL